MLLDEKILRKYILNNDNSNCNIRNNVKSLFFGHWCDRQIPQTRTNSRRCGNIDYLAVCGDTVMAETKHQINHN